METVMWVRHGCDWAVRLATVAASLCPTLSSLGGAVVGVLIAVMALVAPRVQHGRALPFRRRAAAAGEEP